MSTPKYYFMEDEWSNEESKELPRGKAIPFPLECRDWRFTAEELAVKAIEHYVHVVKEDENVEFPLYVALTDVPGISEWEEDMEEGAEPTVKVYEIQSQVVYFCVGEE